MCKCTTMIHQIRLLYWMRVRFQCIAYGGTLDGGCGYTKCDTMNDDWSIRTQTQGSRDETKDGWCQVVQSGHVNAARALLPSRSSVVCILPQHNFK